MALDEQDRRILRRLQRDGRISNQDLAEATGLSPSSCWRRVKALEEAGIIRDYVARVDAAKCGLAFHAIVHVRLQRHDPNDVEAFTRAVVDRTEVQSCFATTGEADYHLDVLCEDQGAYNRFLETVLFRLPGVSSVRTNLVLKPIKAGGAAPV
ncbi:MAG: Lrp/AsnC family transcriptional regulator [Pseudomonadota bacterium]